MTRTKTFPIIFTRTLAAPAVCATATLTAVFATPATAHATTLSGCAGGGFTVTQNGSTVKKLDSAKLTATTLVNVRGRYIEFDFASIVI